jgi:hypothetical protein
MFDDDLATAITFFKAVVSFQGFLKWQLLHT